MIRVPVTDDQIKLAFEVGGRRRMFALKNALRNHTGMQDFDDPWDKDINGALGELAFAKAMNIFWDAGTEPFQGPDVGVIHVRTTSYKSGKLIVRQHDKDGIYALALVNYRQSEVALAGWVLSDTARDHRYWTQLDPRRPGAWAVPQADLWPIEELINGTWRSRRGEPPFIASGGRPN